MAENEMETILDCDGSVCVPCGGGAVLDCASGPSTTLPCDDGDPNTINDEQTILACDGSICIPCQGEPVDCSNGSTSIDSCDDGDAFRVDRTDSSNGNQSQ